ncbi:MAG: hypothetical protein ACRER2_11410 [Methylococcales bacterium]
MFQFLMNKSPLRPPRAAFARRLADRTADVFYLHMNKGMTVDEPKHALTDSRKRFRALEGEAPRWTVKTRRLLVIQEALADIAVIGRWKNRWLTHPFPNRSAPEKTVC